MARQVPEPLDRDDIRWSEAARSAVDGTPIWVDIRFGIQKLTQIDTVNGTAFVKLTQVSYWTDTRLIGWQGEFPDGLWGPKLNLANSVGNMNSWQDEFSLLDAAEGRLKRVYMFEGHIDNDMDLRDFPFDLESIALMFTCASRWESNDGSRSGKQPTVKSYRLRKVSRPGEGNFLRMELTNRIPEFELHGMSTRIDEQPPNDVGSERTRITVRML
jgi:hypothetical protein